MKRIALAGIAALALLLAACSGSSSSSSGTSSNGKVTLQFWTAQTPPTDKVINNLAAEFNATHPNIVVQASSGGTSTGDLLPKVTTALAAGTAPDVAYIYGSYAANIAQSGKTVNLRNIIHTPGYNWNDFYPASQQIVSPGGKVIGFPALIDNLSVIYNKKLFAAAGVPVPSPNWTWDQFRAIAKKMTNPAKHIYGVNYPIGGDTLDTSWRFFPGLWQRGGQILSPDHKKALFNSQAGVANLTLWQQMATVDHSVYLDPTASKAEPLFTSGHLAMFVSGPWEVPVLNQAKMDWADVPLPAVTTSHQTVSGPDNWVIFNNGRLSSHLRAGEGLHHVPGVADRAEAGAGVVDRVRLAPDPAVHPQAAGLPDIPEEVAGHRADGREPGERQGGDAHAAAVAARGRRPRQRHRVGAPRPGRPGGRA